MGGVGRGEDREMNLALRHGHRLGRGRGEDREMNLALQTEGKRGTVTLCWELGLLC